MAELNEDRLAAELSEAEARAEKAEAALAQVEEIVGRLMKDIGAESQRCKYCPETIFVLRKANGNWAPYTKRGLLHFIDCVGAKEARRAKKQRGSAAVLTLVALVIMAILGLFLWGCDAPAAERDACWGIASCTADACRGIASCTAWEVREPRGIRQALEAQGRCGEALTALAACETRCPRED